MADKSKGTHQRILYACGHLYAQCRCMGLKLTRTLPDPCPECIKTFQGCTDPVKAPK